MPNIKSAKKRVLIAKVNSERNKADKSALKTTLKKFEAAVAEGNREQADSAYQAAVQSIDKAAGKGILHKNAAARKKSADYTVAARLQGEDGSTYDAVFCFRYDRLAGGT